MVGRERPREKDVCGRMWQGGSDLPRARSPIHSISDFVSHETRDTRPQRMHMHAKSERVLTLTYTHSANYQGAGGLNPP